ncbi:MAG TPA: hypothetical protein VM709_15295, partial [Candidatus Sulfotelmatobacter sp.]|nr:hypothetical protein [Candidatus Sulfotelmatobacter sp.]
MAIAALLRFSGSHRMRDKSGKGLRKPVGSAQALRLRKKALVVGVVLALGVAGVLAFLLAGCGGGTSAPLSPAPPPAVQPLQVSDVQNIIEAAVNSVDVDMVVAVADRAGFVLGLFRTQNAPAVGTGNFGQSVDANDLAVAL